MTGVAVILAAGHADRMGSNKLVLPLGSGTVIGGVLTAALAACDRVIVVMGLHDQGTRTAVERTVRDLGAQGRVEVVEGVPYDPGMFISVQAGLRRAGVADIILVFPGDIPLVSGSTAVAVRDAVRGGALIAVPVYAGRRGHPLGLAGRCMAELLAMSERSTLRHYVDAHAVDVVSVPVEDADMLMDIDTPQDYRHAVDRVCSHGPENGGR